MVDGQRTTIVRQSASIEVHRLTWENPLDHINADKLGRKLEFSGEIGGLSQELG